MTKATYLFVTRAVTLKLYRHERCVYTRSTLSICICIQYDEHNVTNDMSADGYFCICDMHIQINKNCMQLLSFTHVIFVYIDRQSAIIVYF